MHIEEFAILTWAKGAKASYHKDRERYLTFVSLKIKLLNISIELTVRVISEKLHT